MFVVPKEEATASLNASVDGGGGERTSHGASMKTARRMRQRADARSVEELREERRTVGGSGMDGRRGLIRSLRFGRGRVRAADELDRWLSAGSNREDRRRSLGVASAGERVADGDGRGSCLW